MTDDNGSFCFPTPSQGCYELRASRRSDVNVIHMYLWLVPTVAKRRPIEIWMELGE
jgi:hypothetical protein